MNKAELIALKESLSHVARADRIPGLIAEKCVPLLAELVAKEKQIENSIQSLKDAFEVGFTEAYYGATSFDCDPLDDLIDARIAVHEKMEADAAAQQQAAQNAQHQVHNLHQQAQQEIDALRAQVAALQGGSASSGSGYAPAPAPMRSIKVGR